MYLCFFGHIKIFNDNEVRNRLTKLLQEKINASYTGFRIGTHGEFDKLALSVCGSME